MKKKQEKKKKKSLRLELTLSAAPEATQPDVPSAAGGAHRSLVLSAQ